MKVGVETQHEMPDGKKLIVKEITPYISELWIEGNRKVLVGRLNKATGILTVFKVRTTHEHHRTGTYGFNSWLLNNSKLIKKLHIYENNEGVNNQYLVPKDITWR